MKVITEKIIREELKAGLPETYVIPEGKILSPAAREFLQQCQVRIEDPRVTYKRKAAEGGDAPEKPQTAAPAKPVTFSQAVAMQQPAPGAAAPKYVDEVTGSFYYEKPEHMTQLHGNYLVSKDDPRIAFRGKLDSLGALIVCCQANIAQDGADAETLADLDDILANLRTMMRCDVMGEPYVKECIIGLNHQELRERSHNPQKFYNVKQMILPDYRFGRVYAELNYIRTQIRELEVAAVSAYRNGKTVERTDLIEGLNRMSSAVHIVMCKYLAAHQ